MPRRVLSTSFCVTCGSLPSFHLPRHLRTTGFVSLASLHDRDDVDLTLPRTPHLYSTPQRISHLSCTPPLFKTSSRHFHEPSSASLPPPPPPPPPPPSSPPPPLPSLQPPPNLSSSSPGFPPRHSPILRLRQSLALGFLPLAFSLFPSVLRSSLSPSSAYSLLLSTATEASAPLPTLQVLSRMLALGVTPSFIELRNAIRVLCHRGHIEEGWDVLSLLLSLHCSPASPPLSPSTSSPQSRPPSLLPLLPVLPPLLGWSYHNSSLPPQFLSTRLQSLRSLLTSRLSDLRPPDHPKEFVGLSLALLTMDSVDPLSSSLSVPAVTSLYRSFLSIQPPLSARENCDVYHRVISVYVRLSAWAEGMVVLERWSAEVQGSPSTTTDPSQQLNFRSSVESLLVLSRALYLRKLRAQGGATAVEVKGEGGTGETAVDAHRVRVRRVLSAVPVSRMGGWDERTLMVVLCVALPPEQGLHPSLIEGLRLPPTVHFLRQSTADLEGGKVLIRELVEWVEGQLRVQPHLHPSQNLQALLVFSSLILHSTTSSPRSVLLSILDRLRQSKSGEEKLLPSYPLLHSLLQFVLRDRWTPFIAPLLQTFASEFHLPPTLITFQLLTRYLTAAARSPLRQRSVRLAHIRLLFDLNTKYRGLHTPLPTPLLISALIALNLVGGDQASRLLSVITHGQWESSESVQVTQLALRCWLQGGTLGRREALRWWRLRMTWEKRREGRKREKGIVEGAASTGGIHETLLALDDGVVQLLVEGLKEGGEDDYALEVAMQWTKWTAGKGGLQKGSISRRRPHEQRSDKQIYTAAQQQQKMREAGVEGLHREDTQDKLDFL